jgi:hypothetical protein
MALTKISDTTFDVDTISTTRHTLLTLEGQKNMLQGEIFNFQMMIDRLKNEINKIDVLVAEAKAGGIKEASEVIIKETPIDVLGEKI